MAKLGYVEPATPSLEGLGKLIGETRQASLKQRNDAALTEALKSRDPAKIAELASMDPSLAERAKNWITVQDSLEKKNLQDLWVNANELLYTTDADKNEQFLKRKDAIREKLVNYEVTGEGNPIVIENLREAMAIKNPDELEKRLKQVNALYSKIAGSGDMEEYKKLMFKKAENEMKMADDWQKKLWDISKGSMDEFEKMSKDLLGGYNTIQNLAPYMKEKGGKMRKGAINVGLTALAKMISPGAVTDSDLKAISGGEDPWFIFYDVIKKSLPFLSSGQQQTAIETLEKVEAQVNPTNPETFDVDKFMEIINAVAGASVPVALNIFEDGRQRAVDAELDELQLNTFFYKGGNYQALKEIEQRLNIQSGGSKTPKPTPTPTTPTTPTTPRTPGTETSSDLLDSIDIGNP